MSTTYVTDIDISKIKYFQLFPTYCKESIEDVVKGCGTEYDVYVMNGTFYKSAYKPVCQVKVNNTILSSDQYVYWGYAWNSITDFHMCKVPTDATNYSNYLSGCAMIKGNKALEMYYNSDVGGLHYRTALGTKSGKICPFVSNELLTPEQLRTKCLSLGWETGIMLDGGGSTQGYFNGKYLYSSDKYSAATKYTERKVQNWIIVYVYKNNTTNPYPVPTRTLVQGCIGDNVKWAQFQLTKAGFACTIDGSFGPNTKQSVINYQKANNLSQDGSIGPITRASLSKV